MWTASASPRRPTKRGTSCARFSIRRDSGLGDEFLPALDIGADLCRDLLGAAGRRHHALLHESFRAPPEPRGWTRSPDSISGRRSEIFFPAIAISSWSR